MCHMLSLSYNEYKILQKHKMMLENRFTCKIEMPEDRNSNFVGANEIIFINIDGGEQNVNNVQDFLKHKLEHKKRKRESDASVIILESDSDYDTENESNAISVKEINNSKRLKRSPEIPIIDLDASLSLKDSLLPEKVSDTTDKLDQSVIVIEPVSSAEDFIPLTSTKQTVPVKQNLTSKRNNRPVSHQSLTSVSTATVTSASVSDVIEISSDEDESSIPIPIAPRRLRPVVIDGSNVARSHGKPRNTFSCKGIKIAVDYFLRRGHTKVTAFVPRYRRFCKKGPVLTTDQDILEELEKADNLAFTPSRRVDGKTYTCYDDRFIVDLAVDNGGVILSNDNYKDLLDVSAEFRATIENRLLMFCFVGDKLMIPEDPLGVSGPTLDEFLSFPPNTD